MAILVVGSVHADARLGVGRLPRPGETVIAAAYTFGLGGKGANQAVAAARGGALVRMIGAVGADANGVSAIAALRAEGVDVSLVRTCADALTGMAMVAVEAAGENLIVVAPGADAAVTPETLSELAAGPGGWPGAEVTLCQGELPADAVDRAAALAKSAGSAFVLNLAPVIDVAPETLALADPLVMNEHEAGEVAAWFLAGGDSGGSDLVGCWEGVGTDPVGVEEGVALGQRGLAAGPVAGALAARRFVDQALAAGMSRSIVVTLGAAGAVAGAGALSAWGQAAAFRAVSGTAVEVADTTGAGDAFVGQLVAGLARGVSFRDAVAGGVAAGSLAVARAGACASYATAVEIECFVRSIEVGEPR
ncbi:MAG: ribokinase [Bifidobacteriaceae bacterium]|jgi:ribokinase|nr:ribokinase [Bifidobacteriaceae bacterium]